MSFNKRLLTCEDANSIISHFGRGFCDYYELDTRDLTSQDFWFAYDFIDIYRTEDIIQFSINNSLWTNGYYIKGANINDFDVDVEEDRITVTGTGLEWCILVLELSPEFRYDDYVVLDFKPEFLPVIRPFYESIHLVMGFMDNTGTGVAGLSVEDLITGESLTTDNNGLVSVISSINHHGEFDYQLETTNGGETVDYNFPYIRVKTELPVSIVSENLFKNSKNTIVFKFLFDDTYNITPNMLFTDNNIQLIVNNTVYTDYSINGTEFMFNIDLTDFDNDYLNLSLVMSGNDYLEDCTYNFVEHVTYFNTDSVAVLAEEISNIDGAEIIDFTGTVFDDIVDVTRSVNVRFIESESISVSDGSGFNVSGDVILSVDGLVADGGDGFISLADGASCVLNNCSFSQVTGIVVMSTGFSDVTVRDCSFLDNYSCISTQGNVDLYNCTFDLLDTAYLDTSTVAFVDCLGDLTIDYSKFNVNLAVDSGIGFGYLFFKLANTGSVNGVSCNNLNVNESFPFKKNVSDLYVEFSGFIVSSLSNKSVVWTIENTNVVYTNQVEVKHV